MKITSMKCSRAISGESSKRLHSEMSRNITLKLYASMCMQVCAFVPFVYMYVLVFALVSVSVLCAAPPVLSSQGVGELFELGG